MHACQVMCRFSFKAHVDVNEGDRRFMKYHEMMKWRNCGAPALQAAAMSEIPWSRPIECDTNIESSSDKMLNHQEERPMIRSNMIKHIWRQRAGRKSSYDPYDDMKLYWTQVACSKITCHDNSSAKSQSTLDSKAACFDSFASKVVRRVRCTWKGLRGSKASPWSPWLSMAIQWVSNGIQWYPMVSNGIQWYPMVLKHRMKIQQDIAEKVTDSLTCFRLFL